VVCCRDDRPPPRDGGDGGRFDRRSNYDRPSYDRPYRGSPGPLGRDGSDRDRHPYSDDGPGYNRGPPGGGYNRRSGPESPHFDGPGMMGPGDFPAGRRMSRGLSPDDGQAGPPLSKVMFIKRMIDEDLPEKEIDRRCALAIRSVYCCAV
jgi:hypothetical protein